MSGWSKRRLEEIGRGLDPALGGRIGWFVLLPIVRALGAKETLPEAYDAAVSIFGPIQHVREILQRIPPARRERLVERLIEERRARPPMERLSFLERLSKKFLDLVPEATAVILRELDRPENSSIKDVSDGVDEGFDEFRGDVPRIDAILKDYAKANNKR